MNDLLHLPGRFRTWFYSSKYFSSFAVSNNDQKANEILNQAACDYAQNVIKINNPDLIKNITNAYKNYYKI